jgi:hypothetical protein
VLQELAPDAGVMSAEGFALEPGQTKPTHAQRARFILKARHLGDTARQTPEATLEIIDEHVARLSRGLYGRSSLSSHLAAAQGEVLQIKLYVDALLSDLIGVHERA